MIRQRFEPRIPNNDRPAKPSSGPEHPTEHNDGTRRVMHVDDYMRYVANNLPDDASGEIIPPQFEGTDAVVADPVLGLLPERAQLPRVTVAKRRQTLRFADEPNIHSVETTDTENIARLRRTLEAIPSGEIVILMDSTNDNNVFRILDVLSRLQLGDQDWSEQLSSFSKNGTFDFDASTKAFAEYPRIQQAIRELQIIVDPVTVEIIDESTDETDPNRQPKIIKLSFSERTERVNAWDRAVVRLREDLKNTPIKDISLAGASIRSRPAEQRLLLITTLGLMMRLSKIRLVPK